MVGGIVIIVLGIIFLLQNYGLLPSAFWGTLWPLILIIIGLNIVIKKNKQNKPL